MASIQWTTPAVLWPTSGDAMYRPWLAEFRGDGFLPDFLELMGGEKPSDLRLKEPALTDGRLKLYQALHGRYYLVTGSLVCRQVGLPDRAVERKNGQRTSFVLRRWPAGDRTGEQGWVREGPNKGWRAASPDALVEGEERLPLHDVPACVPAMFRASPDERQERVIYYGYVPVDAREKYLVPLADPAEALRNFPPPAPGETAEPDARLGELEARVLRIWRALYVDPVTNQATSDPEQNLSGAALADASLYLLLDLGDFLKRVLPDVFAAAKTASGTVAGAGKQALLASLRDIRIKVGSDWQSLAAALAELEPFLPMVQGLPPAPGFGPDPPRSYDVKSADRDDPSSLSAAARIALSDDNAIYLRPRAQQASAATDCLEKRVADAIADGATPVQVPPELAEAIKSDPPADGPNADRFVLRLVYEYDPCPALLSQPTDPFALAKALDPDAPARTVRIELPSPSDLRKFKRGVAMEMPPDLRSVMDRVHKGLLKGEGLGGSDVSWQLGLICSFSIPIITLVAFIVMMIFLILLNYIFWWLPFLKICFPIPTIKRRSA